MKIKDLQPSTDVKTLCPKALKVLLVFFLLGFSAFSWAQSFTELPALEQQTWAKDKKVFNQLKQERLVKVSVLSDESEPIKKLIIKGAMVVKANHNLALKEMSKFKFLKDLSSFVKEVKENRKAKTLFVHMEAFGYHLRLNFDYELEYKELFSELRLRVNQGPLKNMIISISLEDYRRAYSILAIRSLYRAKEYPFPKLFLTFGIEVVLKNIAIELRSYLEKKAVGANS